MRRSFFWFRDSEAGEYGWALLRIYILTTITTTTGKLDPGREGVCIFGECGIGGGKLNWTGLHWTALF